MSERRQVKSLLSWVVWLGSAVLAGLAISWLCFWWLPRMMLRIILAAIGQDY